MKQLRLYVIVVFVLLIPSYLITVSLDSDDTVITINGIPVPRGEYELFLNRNIAGTYNHFHLKSGVQDHPDFWKTSYGGQTPSDYIKEKTVKQLIDVKVRQHLAIEMRLISNFTFETFQNQWKQDNLNRKAKYESGEVVYGPVENSLPTFYDYYLSKLFIELEEKLNQTRFRGSEQELKLYYEKNKEKWFKYTPGIEVEYLEFGYRGSLERDKVHAEALSISKETSRDKSLKKLTSDALYDHKTFTSKETITGEDNPDQLIKELALRLNTGEVKVMEGRANAAIYLMRCLSREKDEFLPFCEVQEDVLWYYQKEQYQRLIKNLNSNAEVTINRSVYQGLEVGGTTPENKTL